MEKEMKLLAEERRREKMEDKLARQRVKEQIERDKLARKEMFGGGAANSKPITDENKLPSASSSQSQPAVKKDYDSARIQVSLFFSQVW